MFRCEHCMDTMDQRFRRTHVAICEALSRLWQPHIDRWIDDVLAGS